MIHTKVPAGGIWSVRVSFGEVELSTAVNGGQLHTVKEGGEWSIGVVGFGSRSGVLDGPQPFRTVRLRHH